MIISNRSFLFLILIFKKLYLCSASWQNAIKGIPQEQMENAEIVSMCVNECVSDSKNDLLYSNIDMNATFRNVERHTEFSTSEVYNFQSVATNALNEALQNEDIGVKVVSAFVVVKDQKKVFIVPKNIQENSTNKTDTAGKKSIILFSSIVLSYLNHEEIQNFSEIFSSMFSSIDFDDYHPLVTFDSVNNSISNYTVFEVVEFQAGFPPLNSDQVFSTGDGFNKKAFIIATCVLGAVNLVFFSTIMYLNGYFPCCIEHYYDSDDDGISSFEDEPKSCVDDESVKRCKPFSEEPLNDFKITPMRGIYRNHQLEESILNISENDVDISAMSAAALGIEAIPRMNFSRARQTLYNSRSNEYEGDDNDYDSSDDGCYGTSDVTEIMA